MYKSNGTNDTLMLSKNGSQKWILLTKPKMDLCYGDCNLTCYCRIAISQMQCVPVAGQLCEIERARRLEPKCLRPIERSTAHTKCNE